MSHRSKRQLLFNRTISAIFICYQPRRTHIRVEVKNLPVERTFRTPEPRCLTLSSTSPIVCRLPWKRIESPSLPVDSWLRWKDFPRHNTRLSGSVWPGAAFPEESRRQEIARTLDEEHGCVAVFLSQEEATAFYEGFSNSSIWPLLHYLPNYLRYEPGWWEHYQNVNRTPRLLLGP